ARRKRLRRHALHPHAAIIRGGAGRAGASDPRGRRGARGRQRAAERLRRIRPTARLHLEVGARGPDERMERRTARATRRSRARSAKKMSTRMRLFAFAARNLGGLARLLEDAEVEERWTP